MKTTKMNNGADAFRAQLRRYEIAERTHGNCYGHIMQATGKMLAMSVLKKLIRTGEHIEIISALRRDIMSGTGDGFDLVQVACLALMEETEKAHERNGATLPDAWTEKRYTIRKIDKRVLIQTEDSAKWSDCETCAVTEVYRAIRAAVQSSRGIQLASLVYCYYEDFERDDETGVEETVYRRMKKYSSGVDEDGTTSETMAETIAEMIEKLELTATQKAVLEYRLQGYGCKAIASHSGKSKQAVQKTMKQIQQKALSAGMNASTAVYFALSETETETETQAKPEETQAPEIYASNMYNVHEWKHASLFDDYT